MSTRVIALQECSDLRPGQLERVRFFDRMLLSVDDMVTESHYYREKLKRHNRYVHGTGIVCGLEVTRAPSPAPSTAVQIGGGYALGPFGDEIFVGEPVILDLAKCGPGAATDPCEPSIIRGGNGVGVTVIVAIKYAECLARPVRAMPAGCACEDEDCKYSRIRDSFQVSCLDHLPQVPPIPPLCDFIHGKENVFLTCPPVPSEPWVVLARVTLPSGDHAMSIDTSVRRYIFSTAVIQDQLITCCCGNGHHEPPPPAPLLKVNNVIFGHGETGVPPVVIANLRQMNPDLKEVLPATIPMHRVNAIDVEFSNATLDPMSVDSSTFFVTDPNGQVIPARVVADAAANKALWVSTDPHNIPFTATGTYTITVKGGAGQTTGVVKSADQIPLDGETQHTFPSGEGTKGGDFILKFTIVTIG